MTTTTITAAATLRSLCNINLSVLSQKLLLINALRTKFPGDEALDKYKSTCPLVGATIGQHVRHSMDHVELAVLVAAAAAAAGGNTDSIPQLHYDLRVRGGTLEHDMDEACKRISDVSKELASLAEKEQDTQSPVQANFMLSGDGAEFGLSSSIGRELGFSAHHAIHHMAMIKLIAIHHVGLTGELPPDFGRAPSTANHDTNQ